MNYQNAWMGIWLCAIVTFEVARYVDYRFRPEWPSIPLYVLAGMFAGYTVFGEKVVDTATSVMKAVRLDSLASWLQIGFQIFCAIVLLGVGLVFDRKVAKRQGQEPRYEQATGLIYGLSGLFFVLTPPGSWIIARIFDAMNSIGLTVVLRSVADNPAVFWLLTGAYVFKKLDDAWLRRRAHRR